MSNQVWFYEKDQKAAGPVSELELWELLNSGEITKESLVWKEPMEKWLPFSEVPQLKIPPKVTPVTESMEPPQPKEREEIPASADSPFKAPGSFQDEPEEEEKEEKRENFEYVEKVVFKSPDYESGEAITMEAEYEEVNQVRPWIRFLARMIDYQIFSMIFSIFLGILFPDFIKEMLGNMSQQPAPENPEMPNLYFLVILNVVITFLWVYVEAFSISRYGTTFGKSFLGIRVLDKNGELLPYDRALKRSYSVWLRGMGAGLLVVSWVTMLLGYQSLKRKGHSSWDEDADSKVVHTHFNQTRLIIILVFYFIYLVLTLGSLVGAG